MASWKKFIFFEREVVKDQETQQKHSVLEDKEIVSITTGRTHFIFGETNGSIALLNSQFVIQCYFKGFKHELLQLQHLKHESVLVTVGLDDPKGRWIVRLWDTELGNEENDTLRKIREFNISRQDYPNANISYITVLETLQMMAFGFDSGAILLASGNLMNQKLKLRMKQLRQPNKDLLIGLLFRQKPKRSTNGNILYCVTKSNISFYEIRPNGDIQLTPLESDFQSNRNCCIVSDKYDLALAQNEVVYYFTLDGRGPCFQFQEENIQLFQFRSYLVVLSSKSSNRTNLIIYDIKNRYKAFATYFNSDNLEIVSEWGCIFIIDKSNQNTIYRIEEKGLQTKLETLFKKNLYDVAIGLARDHKYNENGIVDMFRKYGDHLYAKGDYDGAIQQYTQTIGTLEPSYIIRKFLDAQRIENLTLYLEELHSRNKAKSEHTTLLLNCYTKLKNEEKLHEFIRKQDKKFEVTTAIRVLRHAEYFGHALYLAKKHKEHDYCVKLLLEDQKDYQAALDYLKSLHVNDVKPILKEYGNALVNHFPQQTTDLLIDFCTVGHSTIVSSKSSSSLSSSNLQSQNKNRRNFLDENSDESNNFIDFEEKTSKIQIKDDLDVEVKTLDLFDQQSEMSNRNSLFSEMSNAPRNRNQKKGLNNKKSDFKKLKPEKFIHFFVEKPNWLIYFLEKVIEKDPNASTSVYGTLLELYLRDDIDIDDDDDEDDDEDKDNKKEEKEIEMEIEKEKEINLNTSEDEKEKEKEKEKESHQILTDSDNSSLSDNIKISESESDSSSDLQLLTDFNKNSKKKKQKKKKKQTNKTNEENINKNKDNKEERKQKNKQERLTKAYKLLKDPQANYDENHALVLVQMHNFKEGITYMLNTMGLYHEIVQHYMEIHDYKNVIASCKNYASQDRNLWLQVLSYFASIENENVTPYIQEVLETIEEGQLIPPLLVIKILAKESKVTLGTVQEHLMKMIRKENEEIENEKREIKKYQEQNKSLRHELEEFRTTAKIFQLNQCSYCNRRLDLPKIHFMCGHTMHANCVSVDNECPLCIDEHNQIKERKVALEESAENHEEFFHQLENSEDGFGKVAEYFGRSLFSSSILSKKNQKN
ncbi:vacuolar protein sorting-associated protein 11 [Anaeramoeba flamelloides]|uniref:Vacuolar protein sorting-associated protein 11 homolog n=1 Tax=Anaeramoeba flamelloides TaxID=1746091 RepID=A0AAV8A4W6_9EUKA|nr:vacuolar protein sorting-associated protein 11 [Anaeramoeba flamelloides]